MSPVRCSVGAIGASIAALLVLVLLGLAARDAQRTKFDKPEAAGSGTTSCRTLHSETSHQLRILSTSAGSSERALDVRVYTEDERHGGWRVSGPISVREGIPTQRPLVRTSRKYFAEVQDTKSGSYAFCGPLSPASSYEVTMRSPWVLTGRVLNPERAETSALSVRARPRLPIRAHSGRRLLRAQVAGQGAHGSLSISTAEYSGERLLGTALRVGVVETDGRYTIDGLGDSDYWIEVVAPETGFVLGEGGVNRGHEGVFDINLRYRDVKLTVEDEDQAPVQGAVVELSGPGLDELVVGGTTNEHGVVILRLPSGFLPVVSVRQPGTTVVGQHRITLTDDPAQCVLRLPSARRLSVLWAGSQGEVAAAIAIEGRSGLGDLHVERVATLDVESPVPVTTYLEGDLRVWLESGSEQPTPAGTKGHDACAVVPSHLRTAVVTPPSRTLSETVVDIPVYEDDTSPRRVAWSSGFPFQVEGVELEPVDLRRVGRAVWRNLAEGVRIRVWIDFGANGGWTALTGPGQVTTVVERVGPGVTRGCVVLQNESRCRFGRVWVELPFGRIDVGELDVNTGSFEFKARYPFPVTVRFVGYTASGWVFGSSTLNPSDVVVVEASSVQVEPSWPLSARWR